MSKTEKLIELASQIASTRADQERFFYPRMMPIEAAACQQKLVVLWKEFKNLAREMEADLAQLQFALTTNSEQAYLTLQTERAKHNTTEE